MALHKMKQKKASSPKATDHLAKRGLKTLNHFELKQLMTHTKKRVSIVFGNEEYQIPKSEQKLFVEAFLETMDLKDAQKSGAVLSTQEVADLLNVSRPFVVKLTACRKSAGLAPGI
jgi:tRNA A37 threonylcarbamoyladenosine dehydratase